MKGVYEMTCANGEREAKLMAMLKAVQRTVESQHAEIVELQAREAQYRKAIKWALHDHDNTLLYKASRLPCDDTALREALWAERERCAKVCENFTKMPEISGLQLTLVAEEIRALKDEYGNTVS